jgi:hypothetical protein
MTASRETTAAMLRAVWMAQACQREIDRDRVFDALMSARSVGGAPVRASYRPRFNTAVDTIIGALANAPDDLVMVVWRAFPMLDNAHCQQLAAALTGDLLVNS